MAARTLGTSFLAGPSTPRIPCVRAQLDSLPSSAYSVSSLPCFHGQGNHLTSPWSITGSEGVWDAAHHQLQQAVRRQRMAVYVRRSASPEYQPGQRVWLSTRDIKLRLPSVLLSIPPSHLHVISVDQRILTLTSLPIVSAILRSHPLTSSLHCTFK